MSQPEAVVIPHRTPLWKRAMDLCLAGPALLLLAPVYLVLAALVWGFLGRPVLFRQFRPGKGSEPFELLKFRTMRDAFDEKGQLLPDAERLTRFGRFLRSTSLDELPELWNIIQGEMSLVGPRPLLMAYLPHYSPEQARRHEVLPGLTGWAQVNGRNAVSWEEKFALDVWYVEEASLLLDLKIILLTLRLVLARSGISGDRNGTTAPFIGSFQANPAGQAPKSPTFTSDPGSHDQ